MLGFLRKHRKTIFLITIVGFAVGTFAGFGGYYFNKKANIVAKVNSREITYSAYEKLLSQKIAEYKDKNKDSGEVSDETKNTIKREVLQEMINEEALYQEAERMGIKVTDTELLMNIQSYPAFQREGKFDQGAYYSVVKYALHSTPQEFEDNLRKGIATSKLRRIIANTCKITKKEKEFLTLAQPPQPAEKDQKDLEQKLSSDKMMVIFNDWLKDLSQRIQIKVFLDDIEKRMMRTTSQNNPVAKSQGAKQPN